ncbi:MAG: MBL fold metallo-hydrolase [Verrucomicrobiales bacterium]|nr:MBL fold metallo-hydrolase [Verrucomicrobiales bacterium]
MSIQWKILGQPGADNAVFLTVDSGHAVEHFLFDCGEGCLAGLRPSQIQSIGHLAFSHFHMDHVSGFDTFFRHNYNRPDTPINVWGPAGTIDLMHHRFQSFSWNLHHDQPGEWIVRETDGTDVKGSRFLTREAFATVHPLPTIPKTERELFSSPRFTLDAFLLPHGSIPSLALRVIEGERKNISPVALQHSNHAPGKWLQALTNETISDEESINISGTDYSIAELRAEFVVTSPGESLVYLTDFRVEQGSANWSALCEWLQGANTIICECQYHHRDLALAVRNGHMTSREVGGLANDAGVDRLVLQHLSRRYSPSDWASMLDETKEKFARAEFPPEWQSLIPES